MDLGFEGFEAHLPGFCQSNAWPSLLLNVLNLDPTLAGFIFQDHVWIGKVLEVRVTDLGKPSSLFQGLDQFQLLFNCVR